MRITTPNVARIALFHPAFLVPGGAEFLCLQQARALTSAGDDVRIVTQSLNRTCWNAELAGLRVDIAAKRRWSDFLFGSSPSAKLRTRAARASRLLQDVDVVVAHNFPCNTMLGAARTRARRVWQCNEPPRSHHLALANPRLEERCESTTGEPAEFATEAYVKARRNEQAHHAQREKSARFDIEMTARLDDIYAISEFSRDNARKIYGRCAQEVVYPIVRFGAERVRERLPDGDALRVLTHTRLEAYKNVDTVLKGFALYHARRPRAVLHLVGDGPMRERLRALASQLLPEGAVHWHGFLPRADLDALYERCDVLALLTLDEPFGMVFPEAAARGLLLIGPDHGGPFEILDGGRLGDCIDPFEPRALDEALTRLEGLRPEQSTLDAGNRNALAERDSHSKPCCPPCVERCSAPTRLQRFEAAVRQFRQEHVASRWHRRVLRAVGATLGKRCDTTARPPRRRIDVPHAPVAPRPVRA